MTIIILFVVIHTCEMIVSKLKYIFILIFFLNAFDIEAQITCYYSPNLNDSICFFLPLNLSHAEGIRGNAKGGVDMNGDGTDDVIRISHEGIIVSTFINAKITDEFFSIKIQVPPIWSIAVGDLNNDGFNDLVFGGQYKVSFLLFNPSTNTYIEQVMPESILCQRTTLFDINNDGLLDALICNDAGENLLYRNMGEGIMSNDQSLMNLSKLSGNYSAIWTDINNDHLNDLYLSKCKINANPGDVIRTNLLYKQEVNNTYVESAATVGLADNAQTWTTVFEDFNNDGWMDAFIANHDESNRMMVNFNGTTFKDTILNSGINEKDLGAFENLGADINNDGFMDIISDLTKEIYLNKDSFKFSGIDLPFKPSSLLDFNNDGFLDILSQSKIYNTSNNGNNWITFQLHGLTGNRNGIGSKIELIKNKTKLIREVRASQGYSPATSLNINFGIGKLDIIDTVKIYWTSGIVTVVNNVLPNKKYEVAESSCVYFKDSVNTIYDNICNGGIKIIHPHSDETNIFLHPKDKSKIDSIATSGIYQLYYQKDNCVAVGHRYIFKPADLSKPFIQSDFGSGIFCNGEIVKLKSNITHNGVKWNNGLISDSISISKSGKYWFSIDSECSSEQIFSDTLDLTFQEVNNLNDVIITTNQDSIFMNSQSDNCKWYSDLNDINPFYIGCSLTLPFSEYGKILYLEKQESFKPNSFACGKIDTFGFLTKTVGKQGLHFTANKKFLIDSVTMYVKHFNDTGERNIFLYDENQTLIDSAFFILELGKNMVPLNFKITPGKYKLETNFNNHLTNIGLIDYPFPIGDFGTIDSSYRGINFYPDFFNWQVSADSVECHSDKIEVTLHSTLTSEEETFDPTIFPNPATSQLFFNTAFRVSKFSIYDINGKSLISNKPMLYNNSISIVTLTPGFYLLKLMNNKNEFRFFKFYKN